MCTCRRQKKSWNLSRKVVWATQGVKILLLSKSSSFTLFAIFFYPFQKFPHYSHPCCLEPVQSLHPKQLSPKLEPGVMVVCCRQFVRPTVGDYCKYIKVPKVTSMNPPPPLSPPPAVEALVVAAGMKYRLNPSLVWSCPCLMKLLAHSTVQSVRSQPVTLGVSRVGKVKPRTCLRAKSHRHCCKDGGGNKVVLSLGETARAYVALTLLGLDQHYFVSTNHAVRYCPCMQQSR